MICIYCGYDGFEFNLLRKYDKYTAGVCPHCYELITISHSVSIRRIDVKKPKKKDSKD